MLSKGRIENTIWSFLTWEAQWRTNHRKASSSRASPLGDCAPWFTVYIGDLLSQGLQTHQVVVHSCMIHTEIQIWITKIIESGPPSPSGGCAPRRRCCWKAPPEQGPMDDDLVGRGWQPRLQKNDLDLPHIISSIGRWFLTISYIQGVPKKN